MRTTLSPELLAQFSPEDTVNMAGYVDDCACRCRAHFTVKDGLINLHGRPIFDRLLVLGNLVIPNEAGLLRLPDLLAVTGTVNIERCRNLKIMPSQMHVGDRLMMSDTHVRDLPSLLAVGSELKMERCAEVRELPEGLSAGAIKASACTRLEILPAELDAGSLDLSWTAIRSIPAGTKVRSNLRLRGCRQLTEVGEGATVANAVDVRGCDLLFTLPQSMQPSIVITDGMAVINNHVIAPAMSANELSLCLGKKGIEAFPHRHLKNLEQMQEKVLEVTIEVKGPLRGRAVGSFRTKFPRSSREALTNTASRIDLFSQEPLQLTHSD